MTAKDIIILSGPSGAGKTTILNHLFKKSIFKHQFKRSISVTTRPRRSGEVGGRDYIFMTKDKFLKLKEKKHFLETQKVLDHYYGTQKLMYHAACNKRKNLILCIDVKGAQYLKKHFLLGKVISIFIQAPKASDLYQRLKLRGDSMSMIKKKIRLAKKENSYAKLYDYVFVNEHLHVSVKILETILLSLKYRRLS
jgi:guanylate kinase